MEVTSVPVITDPLVTSPQFSSTNKETNESGMVIASSSAVADFNIRDKIKPLNSLPSSTSELSYTAVTVHNRFNVLQSPKFKVGGAISLTQEDLNGSIGQPNNSK